MKKIAAIVLLFFSILLANDEYNIFVSAFGDDVSDKAIESVRISVEKKVGGFEGVDKVVSGKFGRYRAIAVKTKPVSSENFKMLLSKVKAAGYKEAYGGVAKNDTDSGVSGSKNSGQEIDSVEPKKRGLRKKQDLFFKEAPEPLA